MTHTHRRMTIRLHDAGLIGALGLLAAAALMLSGLWRPFETRPTQASILAATDTGVGCVPCAMARHASGDGR